MKPRFKDRTEAGMLLAFQLGRYAGRSDVLVLAIPRGGVPVGHAMAQTLRLPLDVLVVRKLWLPGNEKVTFGALAGERSRVLDSTLIAARGLDPDEVAGIIERERGELARYDRAYRGVHPPPPVRNRIVILVDDGIATGASLLAAVQWVRRRGARRVVIAAPVATPGACRALQSEAEEVVVLVPWPDYATLGRAYRDFPPVSDHEVSELLASTCIDT